MPSQEPAMEGDMTSRNQLPDSVSDAVESIRGLALEVMDELKGRQDVPGVILAGAKSDSILAIDGLSAIMEVLDGFTKTYPIEAFINQRRVPVDVRGRGPADAGPKWEDEHNLTP